METTLKYPSFRWVILLTVLACQVVAGMTILGFAPLIPDMVHSFFPLLGPTDPEFGKAIGSIAFGVMGMMLFVSAIGLLFSGFLVDKFGAFPLMIISLTITTITFISIPLFADTLNGLVVIRVIQGLGGTLFTAAITPIIAIWFPRDEMGKAMGIQGVGMGLGIMIGLNVGPVFSQMTGDWKTGIALMSIISAVVLISVIPIIIMSKKYTPSLPSIHGSGQAFGKQTTLKEIFKMPVFWIGMSISALAFWVGNAYNDLTPSFLAAKAPLGAGYDAVMSGRLMSVTQITGLIAPVLGGILVDNVFKGKNRSVILIGWALAAVFYSAIGFSEVNQSLPVLIPVLLLAGFANPFVSVTINAFAAKTFEPHIVGRTIGLWMSISFFAAAIGVSVGSLALKSTSSYTIPIIIVGVGSVLGFILTLFLKQPVEKKVATVDPVQMPK